VMHTSLIRSNLTRIGLFALLIGLLIGLWTLAMPVQAQQTGCEARTPAGETRQALQVGDSERDFLLYVPEAHADAGPLPVVVVLHGFTDNARGIRDDSDFNRLADEHGFIAMYPQGLGIPPRWNNGLSFFQRRDDPRDVDFLRALVPHLAEIACVDTDRVYITGFSAGGGMAHRAACELSDVYAAAGTVAGAFSEILNGCQPERPVPMIAIHGTDDNVVPYEGDGTWLPDINEWAAEWAERNECTTVSVTLPAPGDDVSGIAYTGCAADAEVVLYTVDGGGHTWPGDPEPLPERFGVTSEVSASALQWQFFSRFRLP